MAEALNRNIKCIHHIELFMKYLEGKEREDLGDGGVRCLLMVLDTAGGCCWWWGDL